MKEFKLQAALDGAKVVTRDGREVIISGYDKKQQEPVIGWIDGVAAGWNMYGQYNNPCENDADLFMAPVERKEWVVRSYDVHDKVIIKGPFIDYPHEFKIFANTTIHEITILE